jgi:hypothetical protein
MTVANTTLAAKAITASTTLGVTGGATIQGMTVGLGGGNNATNTVVGDSAFRTNTTGAQNTAIGSYALGLNLTASNNTAVGCSALAQSTGGQNTAVGDQALAYNNIGTANTAVGTSALSSNTTGSNNSAFGTGTLVFNETGSHNIAIGYNAGFNTTGSYNFAFGANAGSGITTGNYNVVIGGYTGSGGPISATGSNWIVLSDGAGNVRQVIDSAGNVGLGTTSPSASAILDAQSTSKGVRMPNMTTTQKNAISSPAAGLMVFDTTLAKLCVYTGAAWQTITSV